MTTVLLVEDNDDLREMMTLALELSGYTVYPAANGREAMLALEKGLRPALILADLMMPVMNGWELRSALEADPALATIPTLFVSAVSPDTDRAFGATGYLSKPVDIERLLDAVDERCARGLRPELNAPASHP
jgi:CheY-like chemotaxis protein